MELEVQHENQTIILWLRSGCSTDLSLLYELGKTWRYRVVVIRSGFGSLINNTSTLLWFNRGTPIGRDSHGCALADPCTEEREKITIIKTFGARRF